MRCCGLPGQGMSGSALIPGALAGWPPGEARKVIGRLVRAHLVERAGGVARRWRMHDLLGLYARQLSDSEALAGSDEREQARDRLLEYYLSGAHAAGDHLRAL